MLYEGRISDLRKPLQDECWGARTQESPHEFARQNEQNLSKRLKARQMCVDDDDENAISKKPPLLIAQNTQHKLGVRKNYKAYTSKQTFQIGRY